jgi:N-acetylmuramoyl-L-alanine amidase
MNRPDLGGKPSRRGGFFIAVGAFFLVAGGPAAATGPEAAAIASRIENAAGRSTLIFDLTKPVVARARPVADPPRIVVDLPEVAFRIDPRNGHDVGGSKIVKSYRYGQFAPGGARIVVDLAVPALVARVASENTADGARLILDLVPADATRFGAAVKAAALPEPSVVPEPPRATPPAGKPVVVIDPGHGGVDMGATGRHGEQEKTIVLAFAEALRAKIEAGGNLHAIMTREEDVFLPLAARVRFAQRNNAALFLSIHADTLAAPHVEGATVYTVSAAASDAEAARIAEKENRADQAGGLAHADEATEVDDILMDLARRESLAFSRQFARTLVARWRDVGSLNRNPSRSAGFVVLKAYDVPSVLLELGYLSSDRDLTRLTSPAWRELAAGKTAEAVEAFFAARRPEARSGADAAPAAARQD